ncbi:SPOR domain-containing protein [Gracilibacillus massiliensis]|uniref:SPOR domain-containing protein n=1 Tax=Gracilibacillus massiliensis TaxID=1564956 RepID=UPI00071CC0D8|nr:SPOR domain-containing protein [Gracilibacillus massiliensis]
MNNKKQISIQLNQPSSEKEKANATSLEEYIRENHHPVMDEDQTFKRNYTPGSDPFYSPKKQTFWTRYKSLILSALTAILIGSFLGFLMLKIFVDMDPEEVAFDSNSTNNQAVTASSEGEDEESKPANSDTESYQGRAFNFFVTQAGVFSTEGGAEELVQELSADGIKGMVWHRDGSFHVFVGLHSTHEGSKQFASTNFSTENEFYAGKEWQTNSNEINVSEQEIEWLQTIEIKIEEQLSNTTELVEEGKWLDAIPEELTDSSKAMVNDIEVLKDLEDEQAIQVQLLSILSKYENL